MLWVRHLFLVTVLLAGSSAANAAADVEIDRYVEHEMELNGMPGLSLALVEEGKVSYLRAYGVRNSESRQPLRVETPMELASVSKGFTALAIVQLEQDGTVDRDSVVSEYLPELDGGWQGVTLSHLIRHRSGLRRRHDFLAPCCGQAGSLDLDSAVRMLAHADLEGTPGATFSYANSNYVLLAAVIQRMAGAAFTSYMWESVFQPLGMHRTTLQEEVARSWEGASPHEWLWGRVRVSPSRFLGWYGSSRIKSSAEDMGVYMVSMLDPMAARLDSRSAHAGDSNSRAAWWDQLGPDYDLGWNVSNETEWMDNQVVLEHTGSLWGADTAVVLAPERAIGAAVLVNMGTSRAGEIARAIVQSRDGTPLPEPRRTSRMEIPDTWARIFLMFAAAIFGVNIWYGLRVRRQVRLGARAWNAPISRIIRAGVLVILAFILILNFYWGSEPPLPALPTTIQTALPALAASVSTLLLVAAAVGLLPRLKR